MPTLRTPGGSSGSSSASGTITVSFSTSIQNGDLLLAYIASLGATGPSAPTGWTLVSSQTTGTSNLSVFRAINAAGLTKNFNTSAASAYLGQAFYAKFGQVIIDASQSANNTNNDTVMPVPRPTATGTPPGGRYEQFAYMWLSLASIGNTTGMTVDSLVNQASAMYMYLLHNNSTVAQSTQAPAFNPTLSAANAFKTGIAFLLIDPTLSGASSGQSTCSATIYGGTPADSYGASVYGNANLSAYWRLGERQGTIAWDSSRSHSHHGTYVGNPTLGATGAITDPAAGTSVNLDGVDDYVDIPDFSPTPDTYYGLVRRDAPQAYWRLDEPSGTAANDSSGNTKTGTFTGGTATRNQTSALVDGNTATRFQATYVQAPLLTAFNGSTGFTVEMWIKSNGAWTGGDKQLFCCGENGGAPDSFVHCVIDGNQIAKLGFWFDDYSNGFGLTTDTWYHMVWVFEGPSTRIQRIYINGIQQGSGRVATGVPAITTGARSGNGVQLGRVDGASVADVTIDDAAVYNYALTPTQISAHYAARSANGALTVEGWVKADSWTNAFSVCDRRNTANTGGHIMYVGSDGKVYWYVYTDTWHPTISTRVLAVGAWHHLVGVYVNGQTLLMINGEDCGRLSGIGTLNTPAGAKFRIGTDPTGTTTNDGQVDEVAVYSTTLPDATIQNHYALGVKARNPYGVSVERMSGLVGRWTFDEPGPNIFDHTGNGRTGTVVGTVTTYGAGIGNNYADVNLPGDMRYFQGGAGTTTAEVDVRALPLAIFSVEVWFYCLGVQGTSALLPCLIADQYNASNINYTLWFDGGTRNIKGAIHEGGVGWAIMTPVTTLVDNAWSHIVFTYDGTTGRLYVNGVLTGSDSTKPGTYLSPGLGLRFGRRWDNADFINGIVDEIAIYNRPLALIELNEHYAKGIGNPWKIDLAGNANGSSTAIALAPTRRRSLIAVSAGAATDTAQPSAKRRLIATVSGVATVAGAPTRRRSLVATVAGSATTTATITRKNVNFVGSTSGVATTTATITRLRNLTATSVGIASASGQLTGRRSLVAASAGTSTTSATLTRKKSLVVTSVGSSTVIGLIDFIQATIQAGPSIGIATTTAFINVTRSFVVRATGKATAVGLPSRVPYLADISAGKAVTTGQITRRRPLSVSITGVASAAGNIQRAKPIVALSSGRTITTAFVSSKRLVVGITHGTSFTVATKINTKHSLTARANGGSTTHGRVINVALVLWNGSTFTYATGFPVLLWDNTEFQTYGSGLDAVAYKDSTDQFNPVQTT
jgi:hypothetical protein